MHFYVTYNIFQTRDTIYQCLLKVFNISLMLSQTRNAKLLRQSQNDFSA